LEGDHEVIVGDLQPAQATVAQGQVCHRVVHQVNRFASVAGGRDPANRQGKGEPFAGAHERPRRPDAIGRHEIRRAPLVLFPPPPPVRRLVGPIGAVDLPGLSDPVVGRIPSAQGWVRDGSHGW
jgi:hypothetical protein